MRKIVAPPLDHLIALSDDTGLIQHALHDVPNRSTGYCSDDVSRGFIVAVESLRLDPKNENASRLASTYLSYLHDAQMPDGWFHNFMSYDRRWLDDRGTQDSFGRTIWALGYGMRFAPRESWRKICARMFERARPNFAHLEYSRSIAYTIIGLAHACGSEFAKDASCHAELRRLAEHLKAGYLAHRDANWQWYEDEITYDNARLPEAMMRSGLALRDDELIAIGLRTLAFYERIVIENGMFVPVGSDGWYVRGGTKARYGQQPLEAAAMIDAALVAFDCTSDPAFVALARTAFEWFHGANTNGAVMVERGGSRDGIDPESVNPNMGAESTLAYLAGALALAERPATALTIAR